MSLYPYNFRLACATFEAGINLTATTEPFFSDCIGGDVSTLARISITYMTWVCRQLID